MEVGPDQSSLRLAGSRTCLILTALFLVGVVALVTERLTYAGVFSGKSVEAESVGQELLLSLASVFYLAAVWRLRRAASGVASGDAFGTQAITAMRGVGWLLVAGSVSALLVVPVLGNLIGLTRIRQIDADLATLVIGAIGVGQIMIGGLLRRAASNERELADFF